MQVQVDDGALAGFDDFLLDLVANLGDDLLDAGGVDASILHEFDQRQPRDLPANRIKSGEDDGLGRVVHDDLDAGLGLESADVSTLAADYAALHLIGMDVDHRIGVLNGMAGCRPLNGRQDNLPRLPIRLELGLIPNFLGARRRLEFDLLEKLLEEELSRLTLRHAGDVFERTNLFLHEAIELYALCFDFRFCSVDFRPKSIGLLLLLTRLLEELGRRRAEFLCVAPVLLGLFSERIEGLRRFG